MPDQEAHAAQIVEVLKQRYFPIIPEIVVPGWTPDQHEKNRLSRSLAALAVEELADITLAQAANAVVDGGNDNGIDAVCFDRATNHLWLVQAKAGDAPDMGDNKKFCDGIRDLVARRFERFNAAFARLRPDIETALQTEGLQIVGCHAYLGNPLGPHAITDLNQLAAEFNQFFQRFEWRDLNAATIHGWLTAPHAVFPPPVTVTIESWYGVTNPRRAYYGLITAGQLALMYQQYGKTLFEKNIRHYLGALSVNEAITDTVVNRPQDLFYLNNGITAVCSQIVPAPGATYDTGQFTLHGFSVVNGAQTVGSIAAAQTATGTIDPQARVFITLIEVGPPPDSLGPVITRSRNTQNAVHGLHFAALDPNQERLRRDLAISGVTYLYRPPFDTQQGGINGITLPEAALALACFQGVTKTVVAAKKEIGQVFDPNGEVYPRLFRDSLSGVCLCRSVRVYQYLDGIFAASESAETDNFRRMFYHHGRFFILHILARRKRHLIEKPEVNLSQQDQTDLSRMALELAELIYATAEARFRRIKGYLAIFRNMTDAQPLAQDVMDRLTQLDAARVQPPPASPISIPPQGTTTT